MLNERENKKLLIKVQYITIFKPKHKMEEFGREN